jgi:hypothetical protein
MFDISILNIVFIDCIEIFNQIAQYRFMKMRVQSNYNRVLRSSRNNRIR